MAQDFEVFMNTASDGQIDRKARLENNKYISLELAIITTNQQKEGTAYILTLRQRHLALPTMGWHYCGHQYPLHSIQNHPQLNQQ